MIREYVAIQARKSGVGLREAGLELTRGLGVPAELVNAAVAELEAMAAENEILDGPHGVAAHEARHSSWYIGPVEATDKHWPAYLQATGLEGKPEILTELDRSSTKIVAQLANPNIRDLKKKGLVVGYVQSGKTANYSAVMAKAADAGYRMAIVMSGIHNNLRHQTQVRLDHDLSVPGLWDPLTSAEADFGGISNGTARMASKVHMLAVVKKNAARLRRLRDWLHNIPEEARRACPILLIDDEADQATPNTKAAQEEVSRINELVREVWSEIKSGTYVGYTATPFANVFIDPNDETDLYPSDFIVDLPRPETYFGAERIFGSAILPGEDSTGDELDMARVISEDEALMVNAPSNRIERMTWRPTLPPSLIDATRWFILATAARRARDGVAKHSSMLIHTTPYVVPHSLMKEVIDSVLDGFMNAVKEGDTSSFRELWEHEYHRVEPLGETALITWDEVEIGLDDVLSNARVVVDNGLSTDRLDYGRVDAAGHEIVETVIAIGGSTLSRGLTLEGLVVSYFTRAARTYDTLLQMGRWFGYRTGYEELPRVWMTDPIREDFRFLAQIESEIREEMRSMESRGVSPYQYGLRVRSHPGNLAITARNKMHFAAEMQVSYSGQRHQTIQFEERDVSIQRANLAAARKLLQTCVDTGTLSNVGNTRVFQNVASTAVLDLLASYNFYRDGGLNGHQMVKWLRKFASDRTWSVAVVSRAKAVAGTVDLGPLGDVNALVRAPLKLPADHANIKALMTKGDAVVDLGAAAVERVNSRSSRADFGQVRLENEATNGLLVIYPIARASEPSRGEQTAKTRRKLEAPEDLIGLGIVFPTVLDGDVTSDGTFLSVRPDWTVEYDEEDEFEIADTEPDFDGGEAWAGADQ